MEYFLENCFSCLDSEGFISYGVFLEKLHLFLTYLVGN